MAEENKETPEPEVNEDSFSGTPVFPPGTSETHRRRLLKAMAGGSTVAVAGCLGLGENGSVAVETNAATAVGKTSATLGGALSELENADEADIGFEYGSIGGGFGETVDGGALDSPGQFEETVDGLDPDTEYEFRAMATIDDDDAEGAVLSFTTEPEPEEPHFAVELDAPTELGVSEEFELTGSVENIGDETGTQEVTLSIDGERLGDTISESVIEEFTLDGAESETLTLSDVAGAPGDEYGFEISSDDDSATASLNVGEPDYTQLDFMVPDVRPKQLVKELTLQVAFTEEEIIFNFEWDQPDPGGWIHDMIVYDGDDEEWKRYADWDPWALDEDYGIPEAHDGFYEDRLAWMWHDGTLEGFENFGGWMTVMEGVRKLPGAASPAEVINHPHFGEDGLGRDDMRKYIPQSRNGEWWEHDWDDVRSEDELERMLEDGEFIDFPFWRSHRSNPMGHGTNHHILDYRHGNVSGDRAFDTQDWDPEDGPEYMFDPDIVEGGAVDISTVVDENGNPKGETMPDQQEFEQYALMTEGDHENAVEFDPDVAEWDGAMIPRRPLQLPSESGASWRADGVWKDGGWDLEMRRELDTGYVDDMPVEEGESYTFSPAIHHGVSQRWHWVSYPLKLVVGEDAEVDWFGDDTQLGEGTSVIRAEKVEGEPDWDEINTYTIPLMYPGMTDWTWLTSGEHPITEPVRNNELTIWQHHDEHPEDFVERVIDLEQRFASRK